MNINQTIIRSILKHPLLYKDVNFELSRDKVLNHLFFTNGNGFDWCNGELVDVFEGDKHEPMQIPENYFSTPIMSTEKDESALFKKFREQDGEAYKPHEICSKEALTIYPICQYAAIMNLPKDLKLDWLEAGEDACYLALDYFTNPYKHCRDHYIKQWMVRREYDKIKAFLKEQVHFISLSILELSRIKNGWYKHN